VSLVDRHVGGTILWQFQQALAALLAVFAVVNLTEELRAVGSPGWGVGNALWFVALTLPSEAVTLFPAAALLGAVLGLGRMASDNEIVALQAAGVSPRRIAAAALLAAALLALAGAALGEIIAVPLSARAHHQRAAALSRGRVLSTASGVWLRDGSRFVNVGGVRPDGSLGGVYVFDFAGGRALERFVHASAVTQVAGRWQLQDLRESTFRGEVFSSRRLAAAPWSLSIDPKEIRSLSLEPGDLPLAELGRIIRSLRAQHQNPLNYEVVFWRRVSAPIYMGVMVLLAVPLVMVSGRTIRVGERALLAALVGIGFQMFQEMFTNFGLVAALPPVVIAVAPALLALGLVRVLFHRQGLR
jgi:lipopolysaccharide export system permease protein